VPLGIFSNTVLGCCGGSRTSAICRGYYYVVSAAIAAVADAVRDLVIIIIDSVGVFSLQLHLLYIFSLLSFLQTKL
jgi:hypothetical protein